MGATDWLFSASAAQTANLAAGSYRWRIFALLDTRTYDCGSGRVDVVENPASLVGGDARPTAAQMVDRIDAELLARVTGDGSAHSDYTIGTRQISKMPIADLRIMRAVFQAEAQRDANRGRLAPYHPTFVRP